MIKICIDLQTLSLTTLEKSNLFSILFATFFAILFATLFAVSFLFNLLII